MKIKSLIPAALLATLLGAPVAQAGEFYIGAFAGNSSFDGLEDACNEVRRDSIGRLPVACVVNEDSDTSLGIHAGYNFTRWIGLEAGYIDFGEYQATVSQSRISFPLTLSADVTYASVVLTAPFTEKFSGSLRLGGLLGNVTAESGSLSASIEEEEGAFAGASLDYRVTENISLQVRYDDLEVISLTSAGVRYNF